MNEIVTIHSLPKEAEEELMKKIEKVIYPDKGNEETASRING